MNPPRIVVPFLFLLSVPLCVQGADADKAQELFQQAQELAKSQKFEQAAGVMKKVLELAPRNDLYLGAASEYELKSGQFKAGLEHALQAIKINDKVGEYYVMAAANALGDQELELAREYCEKILKNEKEFGSGAVNQARTVLRMLSPRTFTLSWELDPRRGRMVNGALTIAFPRGNLPYQSVTHEISGVQNHRVVKGEANDTMTIVPGQRPFPLTMKVTVKPYSYKKDLEKAKAGPLPAEARAYLGSIDRINVQSPALVKLAAELKGSTPVETARNIAAWMKKNIEYRLEQKPLTELDFRSVDEILQRRHAECKGYAMLYTALCRAAGIPARPVWGMLCLPPSQERPRGGLVSHNWSEFYINGVGWIPIDPQRPETLGFQPTNCIRIFMDEKKTRMALEIYPMLNLLAMYGDRLKFEEVVGE